MQYSEFSIQYFFTGPNNIELKEPSSAEVTPNRCDDDKGKDNLFTQFWKRTKKIEN